MTTSLSHGIGFAIPVTLVQDIMTQIIENGHVARGWLGIEVQDVSPELAESFGIRHIEGISIAGVVRRGPADEAVIEPGDILLRLNDKTIGDAQDALNVISRHKPGEVINIRGIRSGRSFDAQVQMGRRPSMKDN